MKEMALAGTETGEKASSFKGFGEGEVVTGDRACCGKQGIACLSGRNSGFLFRFGTKRLHVYNRQGREVDIPGYFKGLKPGESGEKALCCEHEGSINRRVSACWGKQKKPKKKALKPCGRPGRGNTGTKSRAGRKELATGMRYWLRR
jgi:hypothetical protein